MTERQQPLKLSEVRLGAPVEKALWRQPPVDAVASMHGRAEQWARIRRQLDAAPGEWALVYVANHAPNAKSKKIYPPSSTVSDINRGRHKGLPGKKYLAKAALEEFEGDDGKPVVKGVIYAMRKPEG